MSKRYILKSGVALLLFGNALLFAQSSMKIACVGDYDAGPYVQAVAGMVTAWNPDLVVTVGDNNYTPSDTSTASWDNEVGQYYGQFIRYPTGSTSAYAPGPSTNKFYPALGNHDWDAGINGWYRYFELPGNERYFDVVKGSVHLFFIDSDTREVDGCTSSSPQALWLQQRLAASSSPWKVVIFHHPPYSSSSVHGNTPHMQWPFSSWGATLVFSGHDHSYERIVKNGFNYIVNGIGGRPLYEFNATPEPGSIVRYNSNHGAVLMTATPFQLIVKCLSVGGVTIDSLQFLSAPVPVQLMSFSGRYVSADRVRLDWQTASETQNFGFEVQCMNQQQTEFATIPNSFIAGHGTTLTPHNYFFIHTQISPQAAQYRLKIIDLDGGIEYGEAINVASLSSSTYQSRPSQFVLNQNYPNPFNPLTTITYSTARNGRAQIKVFDALGREVLLLIDKEQEAGEHSVLLDAGSLASGAYYYLLKSGEQQALRHFVVLK